MEELYLQLAKRNGWNYSLSNNRPYFMKNGNYAVPDETTTEEDKELLANIISEGSSEMAQLILLCWNNGIIISGPCSGIREFHDNPPFYLHFSFKASKDLIDPLFANIREIFPSFNHMYRENNGLVRYDIDYPLKGTELSTIEADRVFSVIKDQLKIVLDNYKTKKH